MAMKRAGTLAFTLAVASSLLAGCTSTTGIACARLRAELPSPDTISPARGESVRIAATVKNCGRETESLGFVGASPIIDHVIVTTTYEGKIWLLDADGHFANYTRQDGPTTGIDSGGMVLSLAPGETYTAQFRWAGDFVTGACDADGCHVQASEVASPGSYGLVVQPAWKDVTAHLVVKVQ